MTSVFPTPKITGVDPPSGSASNAPVTVIGEGFGKTQGKGSVKIGDKDVKVVTTWSDKKILVTVPADTQAGTINIIVTNDSSTSSGPYPYPITSAPSES